MNVHMTNIHNIGGTASLAQEGVMQVAKQLGFQEMGMLRRDFKEDYWNTIRHQQDGIIASLYYDDIVIFQYPSWNGTDYDGEFVRKVKLYRGTKLIIFVHDLQKLMFDSEEAVLNAEVAILNRADLLILPSEKMYAYLTGHGLSRKIPVLYQKIWEVPGYPRFTSHTFQKRFLFTGNYDRFPFLKDYHGQTPVEQYDGQKPERADDASFQWKGFCEPYRLMQELARGGFGLVWCDKEYFDRYYSLNQPHKLGFDLAAGIPVVLREGSVHSDFVRDNGLGYVVRSLQEADEKVQQASEEEYAAMIKNIARYQELLLHGAYTKKLLLDAVIQVVEN